MRKLLDFFVIVSGIATIIMIYAIIINPTYKNLQILCVSALTAYISFKFDDNFNKPSP